MQILNTPSILISADSKRREGRRGIGASEFQQCFQVRPAKPQTRLAVAALGLDFIPLRREMVDLVILAKSVGEASVTRLIEVVASGAFRRRSAAGSNTLPTR
jgi:hypothetical protein